MGQLNHIKFDGIDGEATHKDHPGAIVVDSWSWGVSAPAPALSGSGASKATAGELHFMHYCDKAMPLLARASARGKAIKQVVLSSRKAGEGQKDFLKVTMKEVFITSVQLSASDSTGVSVSLAPRFVSIEYTPLDARGRPATPVLFSWNVLTNAIK